MTRSIESLLASASAHSVVIRHDRPTDSWIFIVLDDVRLGPATGGTRMKIYDAPADGLEDALRLGAGMTAKWAAVAEPRGGGKAVIALSRPLGAAERLGLLERYGAVVAALRGGFGTGPDLGTTPEDMRVIGRFADAVHGIHPEGHAEDPGPYTARGVRVGIEAALQARFGSPELRGRTVWIEGVGDVGAPLAQELAERGADLILSDLDVSRLETLGKALGARTVAADVAIEVECDVYAPCAVGATLNSESIPRLRCAVIAGSANNALATEEDATRLHERGILYAPDYVVNGGGALAFSRFEAGERDRERLLAHVETIGPRLDEIFAEATKRGESPQVVAARQVERTLAAAGESPQNP